jgi:hypothetical protein
MQRRRFSISARALHLAHTPAHLGEQREDGDAGVAADDGHVDRAHIEAGAVRVKGLGANLQARG